MLTLVNTFSIVNLIVNLVLAIGFKFIWNMVTMLQFVVFMRFWLVDIPIFTESFLKALKSLALFEFIPTLSIKQGFIDFFGIEQSPVSEEAKGETFFDKLAVFIIAGGAILVLALFALLLRFSLKCSAKVQKCYDAIKRKLMYGTLIRYLLLGTLKMQLATVGQLTIGDIISESEHSSEEEPTVGFQIFGWSLVSFLTASPVLFGFVLWKHRKRLSEP